MKGGTENWSKRSVYDHGGHDHKPPIAYDHASQ